jgi:NAD(P)H-flavin reductase/ferredoxin
MGACVRLAPDVFRIDPDTGKAVVVLEDASAFRSAVMAAKDSCPFVAVDLDGAVDESGTCDEVTVVGVQIIAAEVMELRLRRPRFHYTPGQYAFVRHRDGQGEFHRAYSVVSNHDDEVTFCIRILANGRGGRALSELNPGDVVGLGPAVGRFSLASLSRPKLFVAGGTGLAPVVPMCRAAHAAPKTVIVGARHERDLFWMDDLRAIPNTTVIPVLESPSTEWPGLRGRVTDVVNGLDTASFAEFYTCGSPGMVAAVAKNLRERGVSDDRIHSDSFLPAPPAAMVSPSAASVREPFDWQGLLRRWHFYASLSLAGLIMFYAVTGFIANRADLFHGEDTATVKNAASTIPKGVALTADALTAYMSGVLPEGSHCTVCSTEPGRDCTLIFALPDVADEKREAIATIKRSDRSFTLTEWAKLPDAQAIDKEALTAFVRARVSGDPDLKNREDDDSSFRLDCESVWGTHAVTVDKVERRWQVTTTDQTPVVAIVDLHRGKHAGGAQKILVDLTAILLAFVTASGIAMGLGAAAHRRRMLAGALVLGSLVLLTAFLIFS